MAEGYMVTIDSDDTLEAMVIGRRAYDEELEEVIMPEKPFDALINQMAGLLLVKRRWRFDEVLKIFKEAFPYRNLTTKDIIRAASYMHKRYPRLAWVPFEKDVIADEVMLKPKRTEELFHYYFENLSMIPDEVRYLVVDETSDAPVGILDEAFVAEYGQPGTKFIVRGSPWKITRVYGNNIYVKPVRDPTGAIPSWVGEEIPVPFEVALEVGKIRRLVEEAVNKGLDVDEISENLVKVYPISKEDVKRAIQETVDHIKKGYPTPTDKRVVVEEVEDFIIVHCSFGSLVNRTLARVLGHLIAEDTGYTMGVQQDPYRIVLQTMHLCDAQYVKRLLERVGRTNVKRLAVEAVVKSGLFKRRMLHVAKKVGAISRRVSRRGFQQIGLRQMMESFKGTVIYDEAIKDCLITDLDVMNTKRVLKEVLEGNVEVVCVKTESPSPLAAVGIERISRKTDLIPPEKMHRILVEAARVRILNEVKTFVCSRCWKFVKMMKVKDVPHRLKCPVCKSIEIGVSNETDEELKSLLGKSTKASKEAKEEIRDNAGLISRYGKAAVIALSGRRLRSYDVMEVLEEEPGISDRLFELIIEAEKRALRRRFW
jgi:ATP-dependent Lhr-like helicase